MTARSGRVRQARITDLAALGELSRLSHGAANETRSLGLPVASSPISVFSLFALPLGAFRPHDQIYVFEDARRLSGLARVERDASRDEWTIVELDAIGATDAGEIRYRLVSHLLRDGAKRAVTRFHVACADVTDNVELFMQAGFIRYGQEMLLYRPPGERLPAPLGDEEVRALRIRSAVPLDALPLSRLYATVTPAPVVRLEAYRLTDWERQGGAWPVPRSSLAPILRFADLEAFVQESADGGPDGSRLDACVQVGISRTEQPDYLRIVALPGADVGQLVRFALGDIAERTGGHRLNGFRGQRYDRGVIAPVRTYESPVERRLEEAGFESIATVTLLMKEQLVRVAEPVLVPAVR